MSVRASAGFNSRMTAFGRGFVAAWLLAVTAAAFASEQPPTLAIGAAMPPFSLP